MFYQKRILSWLYVWKALRVTPWKIRHTTKKLYLPGRKGTPVVPRDGQIPVSWSIPMSHSWLKPLNVNKVPVLRDVYFKTIKIVYYFELREKEKI